MSGSGQKLKVPDPEVLRPPGIEALFSAVQQDGDRALLVGGTVRNSLLGEPIKDFDIATTAVPGVVWDRCEAAGMKVIPTGIDHGTVTVVSENHPFEVTTLREDIETDGRHAVVRFGTDWRRDAARRDFTMNALYAELDGTIHDPIGGYDDCIARRVRFIGDAEQRIREDYLRILRFFRFHAVFGQGRMDPQGLTACIRLRHGLRHLSRERIGHEITRLVLAEGAAETLTVLSDSGFGDAVVAGVLHHAPFARLLAFGAERKWTIRLPLRLAALAGSIAEDMARFQEQLKLSNRVTNPMSAIAETWRDIIPGPGDRQAKRILYKTGEQIYRDAAVFAFLRSGAPEDDPDWARTIGLPDSWTAPALPITGAMLVKAGLTEGPELGRIIRQLEEEWITSDYQLDQPTLMARALGLKEH